jgi:hypothetical protein
MNLIIKYIDNKIFNFWVWLGDQMFDYGLIMIDKDKEPLNAIFTQDKDIVDNIIKRV